MAAGKGFSRRNTIFFFFFFSSKATASVRATSAGEKRPLGPLAERGEIYRSDRATEADGATNTKR